MIRERTSEGVPERGQVGDYLPVTKAGRRAINARNPESWLRERINQKSIFY
jgi:hypothetical protein